MAAPQKPPGGKPEFGKRNVHLSTPPDLPSPTDAQARRRKRSVIVGLIALGAGSVALSMAMSQKSCDQKLLANPNDPCKQSSGARGGSTHWLFSGSGHSSSHTTTSSTPSHASGIAGKSATSHGGFGATGAHFSAHGS